MKIVFWNTHENPKINHILADIIYENHIDIITLAEYKDDSRELIKLLSNRSICMEQYMTSGCDRITMFGTLKKVLPGRQDKYYSIQLIDRNYILCGVHLPSQTYSGHQERRNIIIDMFLQDIISTEQEINSDHTILLGDLNENPYEPGCLSAHKLHGLPSHAEAAKGTRTVMGRPFKMFYNPMWNLLGDFQYPPGTYYYNGSHLVNSFWNIYDQVMIRPCIKDKFNEQSLKILHKTEKVTLIDQHKHPRKDISDHLPIIFEIKEESA